jgi:N-methylhydantoinase B/oxoprolinase/acetone carboxylase alpha subunit
MGGGGGYGEAGERATALLQADLSDGMVARVAVAR